MRIARRFNAGFVDPHHHESPGGTAEWFAHTFPQSSLRDSALPRKGPVPSDESLGYSQWSLRDRNAHSCGENRWKLNPP